MTGPSLRRTGRPRTKPPALAGDYIGFRCARTLKEHLAAAARASGRSLSSEVQFRLELSAREERGFAVLARIEQRLERIEQRLGDGAEIPTF